MSNPFAPKRPDTVQAGNTCSHPSHRVEKKATGDDRGGYINKCNDCKMEWWTPS